MLDNDLIILLSTRLELASAVCGYNYAVVAKDQPTQQGTPTDPTIFFEKLFDVPYGYAGTKRDIVTVDDLPQMTETDTQLMETIFQVSALVIQDPTNIELPTASDVVNSMQMFLRHRETVRAWKSVGVNLLRITQVRNPYFEDDRHRNEAEPSFDVTLTHNRTLTLDINSTDRVDGDIHVIQ